MSESVFPKISVVTVSYNAVTTIEETILSVVNQTYKNIEYIIIDGGSTDGTVDIIKKYADRIDYWVSEPDKGIYDAMNKGIKVATGEWVNFMNTGDAFYSNQVINTVVENIDGGIDVLYGDTILKYNWGMIKRKASQLDIIRKRMPFSHQSCFVEINIMKKYKYNLNYRICADYHFFYHLYLNGGHFAYLPFNMSIYEAEYGFSSRNWHIMYKEAGDITGRSKKITWVLYFYLLKAYYSLSILWKK